MHLNILGDGLSRTLSWTRPSSIRIFVPFEICDNSNSFETLICFSLRVFSFEMITFSFSSSENPLSILVILIFGPARSVKIVGRELLYFKDFTN